jgi:hypothetical protein
MVIGFGHRQMIHPWRKVIQLVFDIIQTETETAALVQGLVLLDGNLRLFHRDIR